MQRGSSLVRGGREMEAAGASRGFCGCISFWGSCWLEEGFAEIISLVSGWLGPALFPPQGTGWLDSLRCLGQRRMAVGHRHNSTRCVGCGAAGSCPLGIGSVGECFPCAEQLGKPSVSQQGASAPLRTWQQPRSALGRESINRAVRSGPCAWWRGMLQGAWQG